MSTESDFRAIIETLCGNEAAVEMDVALAVLAGSPATMARLSAAKRGISVKRVFHSYGVADANGRVNFVTPDGETVSFQATEDHEVVTLAQTGVSHSVIPIVAWTAPTTQPDLLDPEVVRIRTGWGATPNPTASSPTIAEAPRSLVAAPLHKKRGWVKSGILARCGFVAHRESPASRKLTVQLFVKTGLEHVSRVGLQLHGSKEEEAELFELLKDTRPSSIQYAALETEAKEIVDSLTEDGVQPKQFTVIFPLPSDYPEVGEITLSLYPDYDELLEPTSEARPLSPKGEGDDVLFMIRTKRSFSLNSGKRHRGYLMTFGERDEQAAIVKEALGARHSGSVGRYESDWQVGRQIQKELEKGSFCSLCGRDPDAIRAYVSRMIKLHRISRYRETKRKPGAESHIPSSDVGEVEDVAGAVVDNAPLTEYLSELGPGQSVWTHFEERLRKFVRLHNLGEYKDLASALRVILNSVHLTEREAEVSDSVYIDRMTIAETAAHLGISEALVRSDLRKICQKVRARFYEKQGETLHGVVAS